MLLQLAHMHAAAEQQQELPECVQPSYILINELARHRL